LADTTHPLGETTRWDQLPRTAGILTIRLKCVKGCFEDLQVMVAFLVRVGRVWKAVKTAELRKDRASPRRSAVL